MAITTPIYREALTEREEDAQRRLDFAAFAQQCFRELNPLTPLAMNWHVEIIAAKLAAVYRGEIRRLIVNKTYHIEKMEYIFHPAVLRRPIASLDGTRVECDRKRASAADERRLRCKPYRFARRNQAREAQLPCDGDHGISEEWRHARKSRRHGKSRLNSYDAAL
jgi:hypothetical protein